MNKFSRDTTPTGLNIYSNRLVGKHATPTGSNPLAHCIFYEQIKEKNYSLSAGQYFEVKVIYDSITSKEFKTRMAHHSKSIDELFKESKVLENEIKANLAELINE
jgi:type I restriction enzyme M protein